MAAEQPLPPALQINPITMASAPRRRTLSILLTTLVVIGIGQGAWSLLEPTRGKACKTVVQSVPILLTVPEDDLKSATEAEAEGGGGGGGLAQPDAPAQPAAYQTAVAPALLEVDTALPERLESILPLETPTSLPVAVPRPAAVPLAPGPGMGVSVGQGHGTGSGHGTGNGTGTGTGPRKRPSWLHPAKGGQSIETLDDVMDILYMTELRYPAAARLKHISGDVVFEVTISKRGIPTKVTPLEGHPILVEATAEVLPKWTFVTVKYKGQAVSATFEVRIRFTLKGKT